jgi:hypothetical protein
MGLATFILPYVEGRGFRGFIQRHPVLLMVCIIALYEIVSRLSSVRGLRAWIAIVFGYTGLMLLYVWRTFWRPHPPVLRLEKRTANPHFFVRNKDDLIKGIILLLIGAVIGWFASIIKPPPTR